MKGKRTFILLTVFLALGSSLLDLGNNKATTAVTSGLELPSLNVKVSSSKQSYILGEVVSLDIEVSNNGQSDVFLKGWEAKSGLVRIFVAEDDLKFRQYSHSGWIRDTAGRFIKPGETIRSKATLLWNFSPIGRVADLSAYKESHIMSELAFREQGVYFIKAVLIIPGDTQTRIESEPVQIVINEPVGDDLKVWSKIKGNPEIAYFLQENRIRSSKEKVLREVEQLASNYPNSILGTKIKESLEKFRESETKRKEFMENLKRRQKPSN